MINNENLTTQHIFYMVISMPIKYFFNILSKITKYNRAHLGGDPPFIRLLDHDPTPDQLVRCNMEKKIQHRPHHCQLVWNISNRANSTHTTPSNVCMSKACDSTRTCNSTQQEVINNNAQLFLMVYNYQYETTYIFNNTLLIN